MVPEGLRLLPLHPKVKFQTVKFKLCPHLTFSKKTSQRWGRASLSNTTCHPSWHQLANLMHNVCLQVCLFYVEWLLILPVLPTVFGALYPQMSITIGLRACPSLLAVLPRPASMASSLPNCVSLVKLERRREALSRLERPCRCDLPPPDLSASDSTVPATLTPDQRFLPSRSLHWLVLLWRRICIVFMKSKIGSDLCLLEVNSLRVLRAWVLTETTLKTRFPRLRTQRFTATPVS